MAGCRRQRPLAGCCGEGLHDVRAESIQDASRTPENLKFTSCNPKSVWRTDHKVASVHEVCDLRAVTSVLDSPCPLRFLSLNSTGPSMLPPLPLGNPSITKLGTPSTQMHSDRDRGRDRGLTSTRGATRRSLIGRGFWISVRSFYSIIQQRG